MGSEKLKIASYNCKGLKYRNYEYLKQLCDNIDVILIQELWLFEFEFGIIESILPDFKYK